MHTQATLANDDRTRLSTDAARPMSGTGDGDV